MADAYELANNESEVKTYYCTQLKFPPCSGYLTVTNKRVIFHGSSTSLGDGLASILSAFSNSNAAANRIVNDVKIDTISGMSSFYGAKLQSSKLFVGLIFIVAALALWFNAQSTNWYTGRQETSSFRVVLGFCAAAVAMYCLLKSFRRTFFLKIYSSQTTGAISIGEGISGAFGSSAAFALSALPTGETDQMMKELSAMVLDIQSLGDRGAEKWSTRATQQQSTSEDEKEASEYQDFSESEMRIAFQSIGFTETGFANQLSNQEIRPRVMNALEKNTGNGPFLTREFVDQVLDEFASTGEFTFARLAKELSKFFDDD